MFRFCQAAMRKVYGISFCSREMLPYCAAVQTPRYRAETAGLPLYGLRAMLWVVGRRKSRIFCFCLFRRFFVFCGVRSLSGEGRVDPWGSEKSVTACMSGKCVLVRCVLHGCRRAHRTETSPLPCLIVRLRETSLFLYVFHPLNVVAGAFSSVLPSFVLFVHNFVLSWRQA